MTIEKIGLGKLLKIFSARDADRIRIIRSDLREERAKKLLVQEGGGDFYIAFWADAKAHVAGRLDLHISTIQRIADSAQRKTLYPLLCSGFLKWLELARRETNHPLVPTAKNFHIRFEFPDLHLLLKIDNVMGLHGADGHDRLIYPFFCKEHRLNEKWARVGLWLMLQGFTEFDLDEFEILDVIAGVGFSGRTLKLKGDEEAIFRTAYQKLHSEWSALRAEYGLD
ncbi:MAG TPA: hypothetical protein PKD99_16150 [Sphingopyxis sp.]|nr:hypothetical protein [Sphingopyxis sp.]HMP46633.1 hypothetical protein [Sphingopyxis sp.]HMQ17603.1 hypothetical protein [Sphingopyxis sp.]